MVQFPVTTLMVRHQQQFINQDAVARRVPRQFDTFDLIVIRRSKVRQGLLQPLIDCLSRKPGFRFGSDSIIPLVDL